MPENPVPARGDALILFGITGDLGASKIIPALSQLERADRLHDVPLIGVGRSERSDDDIRAMLDSALGTSSGNDRSEPTVRPDLRYVRGDATDASTFDELSSLIGDATRPVVYAALPPAVFGDVARAIESSTMPADTRLVVEKPFGDDAASANDLYADVAGAVGEQRLFIVDHFLAKAAVENLLTVRTDNALFDTVLHHRAVRRVRIEMLERDDVAGRGSFYEQVGVVADVVQNHVLQMAALALMERPADSDDDAYHAARSAAISSMSIDADSIVLGQYAGYRDHDDVADDSEMATFCSFTMSLDSVRWSGVPIDVVAGKALDRDSTAITFELDGPGRNSIRFGIKPEPTITVDIVVLDADAEHGDRSPAPLCRQEAELCGPAGHGALGDYATLLDDALDGARRHFAQLDDIVAAWNLVDELAAADDDLRRYEPGSTGPLT